MPFRTLIPGRRALRFWLLVAAHHGFARLSESGAQGDYLYWGVSGVASRTPDISLREGDLRFLYQGMSIAMVGWRFTHEGPPLAKPFRGYRRSRRYS